MSTDRSQVTDLVALAIVAGRPVRADEASAALGVDEATIVEQVESLVGEGLLVDTASGFRPTSTAETSPTRHSAVAGRWARYLAAAGAPPGEIGRALLEAGRTDDALDSLVAAADAGDVEAAGLALTAHDERGGLAPEVEGRLRLVRARRLRAEGRSADAAGDVEIAIRRLDGEPQVDALGFAAAIADDLQQPQRSEVMAALAAERAANGGLTAKLGSILTLQGRSLSRIGFPTEADAAQERGELLLDAHGTAIQQYFGRMNRAWVLLDRGEATAAETAFARLRDVALELEGDVGRADKDAYWARAAFRTGLVADAKTHAHEAIEQGRRVDAPAPQFIGWLALTEGGTLYGRADEAIEAADRALELVQAHLPAWENVVRTLRARALLAAGRLEEARNEVEQALALCPAGADGWRWRMHAGALRLMLLDDDTPWPQREAEDLSDALLQAKWYEAAVDLMTERSRREGDAELGEQAAALAVMLGNPVLAAHAAEAAGLWDQPAARPIGRMVRATGARMPEDWWETWRVEPAIRNALDLPEPDEAAGSELQARIDDALHAAGLAGVAEVLSPAQRRAAGLVRRRPVPRRRWPAVVAAAVGVVALSAATALGVGLLQADAPPEAAATTTTMATTTTTRLEDRIVAPPDQGLFGEAFDRGGPARAGLMSGGVSAPEGIYWRTDIGGVNPSGPVARGQLLYVTSSTTEALIFISQANGSVFETVPVEGRLDGLPAVSFQETEGATEPLVAFTTSDGFLYVRNADRTGLIPERVTLPDGRRARGTPAVTDDDLIVVATDGGLVIGYAPPVQEVWRYPAEGTEPGAAFELSPAYADGIVYAIDAAGLLHVIDAATGEPRCPAPVDLRGRPADGPTVAEGLVLAPMANGVIMKFTVGSCGAPPSDGVPQLGTGGFVLNLPIAVADGLVYQIEGPRLLAIDIVTGERPWVFPPTVEPFNPVTAPVVADGTIYLGTGDGELVAIDAGSGEERWRFSLDARPAGPPAVVDGAVYIATVDGRLLAIAGPPPG
ncbi:MAG: PQQ-binding-like beta-propeller repeat protein [Acidimicrobiia bacterium]|jgi:outer membrane protein assembly factor BamB/tetratricopeptide (TPR) repeat protein